LLKTCVHDVHAIIIAAAVLCHHRLHAVTDCATFAYNSAPKHQSAQMSEIRNVDLVLDSIEHF